MTTLVLGVAVLARDLADLIEQASVFDGQRPLGVRDVGIHGGVIAEVVAVADVGAEIR